MAAFVPLPAPPAARGGQPCWEEALGKRWGRGREALRKPAEGSRGRGGRAASRRAPRGGRGPSGPGEESVGQLVPLG